MANVRLSVTARPFAFGEAWGILRDPVLHLIILGILIALAVSAIPPEPEAFLWTN